MTKCLNLFQKISKKAGAGYLNQESIPLSIQRSKFESEGHLSFSCAVRFTNRQYLFEISRFRNTLPGEIIKLMLTHSEAIECKGYKNIYNLNKLVPQATMSHSISPAIRRRRPTLWQSGLRRWQRKRWKDWKMGGRKKISKKLRHKYLVSH